MIAVPYGMTVHGEEEINAVVDVLRTSTQMGRNVREFESKNAELFGKKHGLMVNSGSSALEIAVELLNLPEGSEVITPVLTFSTTVSCILRNRLVPVYVDVVPGTYVIDVDSIEAKISDKTAAVVIPNLVGNIPDWEKISDICKKHNLLMVEDSADTLGGTLNGKPSGHWSDISITSFYGSHVINCAGNGGLLSVNRDEWAERAKLLRSWGRSSSLFVDSEAIENRFNVDLDGIPYDAKFVFSDVGHNFEPSELGAAFGLVQLSKLEDNIKAREWAFARQTAYFTKYGDWFELPAQTPGTRTGWLAFPLTVKPQAPFSRRDLQIFLEKRNVQTRVVFTGNILRQPGFKDKPGVGKAADFPNADAVMRGGILMACHHGLTEQMLAYVHECFDEFAGQF